MKKYTLVILVLIVATLTACAVKASQDVPSREAQSSTIISEEKNEQSTSTANTVGETTSQNTSKKQSTTTAKPAETSKQSTTKSQPTTKPVATTHHPITQKPTEKQTTTQKQTTTKRQPTTKAPTTKPQTTKPKSCTNNYNHSVSCGNMGRWFSSRSEVKAYVSAEMNKWNSLYENGAIGEDEYFRNCPSGYECWSCSNCGKWTGNFTY